MNNDLELANKLLKNYYTACPSIRSTNKYFILGTWFFGGGSFLFLDQIGVPQWVRVMLIVSIIVHTLWGLVQCVNPEEHMVSQILYASVSCLLFAFFFYCSSIAFFSSEWRKEPFEVARFMAIGYPLIFLLSRWFTRRGMNRLLSETNKKEYTLKAVIIANIVFVCGITAITKSFHYWFPEIESETIEQILAFALAPYFFFAGAVGLGYTYRFINRHMQDHEFQEAYLHQPKNENGKQRMNRSVL